MRPTLGQMLLNLVGRSRAQTTLTAYYTERIHGQINFLRREILVFSSVHDFSLGTRLVTSRFVPNPGMSASEPLNPVSKY